VKAERIEAADLLTVLGCDPEARPDAPGFAEVIGQALSWRREDGRLTVEFPPDAGRDITLFAEAERQCCPGLGWEVRQGDRTTLVINGTAEAMQAMARAIDEQGIDIDKSR
jgi:hypothetical protein